jgi:hypothetical protein
MSLEAYQDIQVSGAQCKLHGPGRVYDMLHNHSKDLRQGGRRQLYG